MKKKKCIILEITLSSAWIYAGIMSVIFVEVLIVATFIDLESE